MRRCEANRARPSMRKGLEAEAGYARGMLGRTAIVVIPTVAGAVTALVLLGPRALRRLRPRGGHGSGAGGVGEDIRWRGGGGARRDPRRRGGGWGAPRHVG